MTDTTMAYSHGGRQLPSMAGAVAHSGPASKRIVTGYGFWIFILSDIVMFAAFFATYAVLLGKTAGGPTGHDLFDLRNVGRRAARSCRRSSRWSVATACTFRPACCGF